MKTNSRNLILMAILGMSSAHLMAPPVAKGKSVEGPKAETKVTIYRPEANREASNMLVGQKYEITKKSLANALKLSDSLYNSANHLGARVSGENNSALVVYNQKQLPTATNTKNSWNFSEVGQAAAKGLQTAGKAIYDAPGKLAIKLNLSKDGKIITGRENSLASATAAFGDRLQNLTQSKTMQQKTVLNPDRTRTVEFRDMSGNLAYNPNGVSSGSREARTFTENMSNLAETTGRLLYEAPGNIAVKLRLSENGQIISGETGSVMSASSAAKKAITESLIAAKASMTPSAKQKEAVGMIYQKALTSAKNTGKWTTAKFNEFTSKINQQINSLFGKNQSSELIIYNEKNLSLAEPNNTFTESNILNHPQINGKMSAKALEALARKNLSIQRKNQDSSLNNLES